MLICIEERLQAQVTSLPIGFELRHGTQHFAHWFFFFVGVGAEVVLDAFGEYFIIYCLEHGYDKMLRTLGDSFESFIQNLDSLHTLLRMSYTKMEAPSFRSVSI